MLVRGSQQLRFWHNAPGKEVEVVAAEAASEGPPDPVEEGFQRTHGADGTKLDGTAVRTTRRRYHEAQ
jgi:hypothetical protein